MKNLKILFYSLTFLLTPLAHGSFISIDNDKDDCTQGWISMDVRIDVDGQNFSFDPSCKFSFDDYFETKNGLKCAIHAGMCSAFSPKNKIEVQCDDGGSASVQVECPAE